MENLKRYDTLLEDLGEEANRYEEVLQKANDLKNNQFEEQIDIPEIDEAEAESLEAHEELPIDEIDEVESLEKTEEGELIEDIEDALDSSEENFYAEATGFEPDEEDKIVDEIFKNIDTPEYLQKREQGLFSPQFQDEEWDEEEDDEFDDLDLEEEELAHALGEPTELKKMHDSLKIFDEDEDDFSDLDSLLSEVSGENPETDNETDEVSEEEGGVEDIPFEMPEETESGQEKPVNTELEKEAENISNEEVAPIQEANGLEELNLSDEEPSEIEELDLGEEFPVDTDNELSEEESSPIEEANGLEELNLSDEEPSEVEELDLGEEFPVDTENKELSEEEASPIEEANGLEELNLNDDELGELEELDLGEELPLDTGEKDESVEELDLNEEFSLNPDEEGEDILKDIGNESPENIEEVSEEKIEEAGEAALDMNEVEEVTRENLDLITDAAEEVEEEPEEAEEENFELEEEGENLDALKDFIDESPSDMADDMSFSLDLEDEKEEELPVETIDLEVPEVLDEEDLNKAEKKLSPEDEAVLMSDDLVEEIPVDEGSDDLADMESEFESLEAEKAETQELEETYEDWEEELEDLQQDSSNEHIEDDIPIREEEFHGDESLNNLENQNDSDSQLSEKELQKIQANLTKMPVKMAIHLRDMLLSPATSAQQKNMLTDELKKDYPNVFRLKAISNFEDDDEDEGKNGFVPILKFASILIIAAFLLSLGYFFALKPYLRDQNLLKSGLKDISKGNFMLGNEKFAKADPGLGWYNRYAMKFLGKSAYKEAEKKLVGVRDPALNVLKKGAVDLDPDDEETRLNIAKLYLAQKRYQKALENDSDPAAQYDDSLYYLHNKDPENFKYLNKIGQAYIDWAEDTRKAPLKQEKLQKAYGLYSKFYHDNEKSVPALSKMAYLSALLDDKVNKRMDFIKSQGLLSDLEHRTLAQLGLYFTDKERSKLVHNIIDILNNQKTKEPWAYYMMGKYYYKSENLDRAELSLVKGQHFNGVINKNGQRIKNKDNRLQSKIDNMLGEVYVRLAQEYSGPTKFNQKERQKFIKLAKHHFQQAQRNDPNNEMSYYHYGNMFYNFYSNYPKAGELFLASYNMLKENQKVIPPNLYYHLSNSLYNIGDYEKAQEFLSELRVHPSFRIKPAIEYMLGMLYYKVGYLDEAREKMNNVIEYYQDELKRFIRYPNPMSIRQNKILYFNAIIHNNLGCIYNALSIRKNDPEMTGLARVHFYKSIELGHRYNNKNILALSKINLKDSIFRDNTRYIENYKVGKRSTMLYEFTPKYLEEYE